MPSKPRNCPDCDLPRAICRETGGCGGYDPRPRPKPTKPKAPVCPRCLAADALDRIRKMHEWRPAPDIDVYAHVAGLTEGTLELLLRHPLALCERHDNASEPSTHTKGGAIMSKTVYVPKPDLELAEPTSPTMYLVSSVKVERRGGHDHVQLWNRGGFAGELVLLAGDGAALASRLNLEQAGESAPAECSACGNREFTRVATRDEIWRECVACGTKHGF